MKDFYLSVKYRNKCFHSAYVVALDIHHTASKSTEKITNSNGGIVELMSTLTTAHQTAKQACGLARILGSLPGYGTKDLTDSFWWQQPAVRRATGSCSNDFRLLICVTVGVTWLRQLLMLLLDETLLLARLHCITVVPNCVNVSRKLESTHTIYLL